MRIGIVGGGLAGLTLAWFLDGLHDVVLLEARPRLGGNADSVQVRCDGRTHTVDLGVRETAPASFPVWRHVAREVGLTTDDLVTCPSTRTLTREPEPAPAWVSSAGPGAGSRPVTPDGPVRRALTWFAAEAARWEAEDLDWDSTLGDALESGPGDAHRAADLLCALPASLHGCTLEEARGLSARAAGAPFTGPRRSEDGPPEVTYLRGGAGALVHALADDLRTVTVRVGTPLRAITAEGGCFTLVDAVGGLHSVDAVVLALPADRARDALAPLAGTEELRGLLAAVAYRELAYALHSDPFGMPTDRAAWSTVNTAVRDGWSETTAWYGPAYGADLFVSQVTHRAGRPRRELARSAYRALLPTPEAIRAQRRLASASHRERLFFAGRPTTPIDTQEAAMASAAAVAGRLAPDAGRLRRLRHRKEGD
ncbi:FAD-dependent oxidoreductase [Streptomyces sp. NPDC047017]|uniref:FAD-dependent oxidoreductase n=1 Tax=Streptomyces sp. NPDC047017 TaxID=3155024 RepID=UPI0033EA948C